MVLVGGPIGSSFLFLLAYSLGKSRKSVPYLSVPYGPQRSACPHDQLVQLVLLFPYRSVPSRPVPYFFSTLRRSIVLSLRFCALLFLPPTLICSVGLR